MENENHRARLLLCATRDDGTDHGFNNSHSSRKTVAFLFVTRSSTVLKVVVRYILAMPYSPNNIDPGQYYEIDIQVSKVYLLGDSSILS